MAFETGGIVDAIAARPTASVAVADMDLEGRPDLVGAFQLVGHPPVLEVRRNLGGRQFAGPLEVPVPALSGLFAPVDVNGEGAPDLVLGRGSAPQAIAVMSAVPVIGGDGVDFGNQASASTPACARFR